MNRYILRWIIPLWGRGREAVFGGATPDSRVTNALNRPWLAASINGPIKHPGWVPQRTSSMVTPQSILHGVPYLEAVQLEQKRLGKSTPRE